MNVFAWRAAVKEVRIPKSVCGTHLCCDSTDSQIERHGRVLAGHPNYSGKIMKVALRRMVISDGKRRIRYFSDRYTPKFYDSHWVKINKVIFVEKFGDGVFTGDGHFQRFQNETGIKCYMSILTAVGKSRAMNNWVKVNKNLTVSKKLWDQFVKAYLRRLRQNLWRFQEPGQRANINKITCLLLRVVCTTSSCDEKLGIDCLLCSICK